MSLLWIPPTLGAASFQVARNSVQRRMLDAAGPWGATLVRFLFGLPFAALLAGAAWLQLGAAAPRAGPAFWIAASAAALSQILATAAMLVSMRRSSFALGTLFQQSAIPLSALIGLALGEPLSAARWAGIGLVTAGVLALGWPGQGQVTERGGRRERRMGLALILGLIAGAGFAAASNAARQAALALLPDAPVRAALLTLLAVQGLQAAGLTLWLALTDRAALAALFRGWRASLAAGALGTCGSGLWFIAFALSPVGPVRALGVLEMPLAALAGRRLFAERFTPFHTVMMLVIAGGVGLAALG
ncbi:MAG: EamA/RhaT family transporter [Alphaproteobacteria bacterium]|nr:EamA/RhaT family transporter [Alphaproteobacteria bacterium]